MYEIIIDTNIYRNDPLRKSVYFLAIRRLCEAGIVKLHIPYIVEREFQTQQIDSIKKDYENASSALNSLVKKSPSPDSAKQIQNIQNSLKEEHTKIQKETDAEFLEWLKQINAIRHPLSLKQTSKAFEAYFTGALPLKEPKVRKDIPDSFIYQQIVDLSKKHNAIIFICQDGNLSEAVKKLENASIYKSLKEFIETDTIQNELLELDIVESLPSILTAISKYESDTSILSEAIKSDIGETLIDETLHSGSIPDDNNEATINGYYEAENIDIDFNEYAYYGEGEIGVTFSLEIRVSAFYYLYKSDVHLLDTDALPSLTDHNRHYFEVDDEFETTVVGIIKLKIETKSLELEQIENHIDEDSIEIAEIESIELY